MKSKVSPKLIELFFALRSQEIEVVNKTINDIDDCILAKEMGKLFKALNELKSFDASIRNRKINDMFSSPSSQLGIITIIENVLADLNFNNAEISIDYRSKSIFHLRYRLYKMDILRYRGLRDYSIGETNTIIRSLIKLEAFDEAAFALRKAMLNGKIYLSNYDYKKLEAKTIFIEYCSQALSDSTSVFIKSGVIDSLKFGYDETVDYFKENILRLETYYKKSNSKLIQYYLFWVKYALSNFTYNFNESNLALDSIEKILQKRNKTIYTNNRLQQLLLNKADLLVKKGEFIKAVRVLKISNKLTDSKYNLLLGEQLKALSYLHLQNQSNFNEAYSSIENQLSTIKLPIRFLVRNKLILAGNYFVNGKFKLTCKLINGIEFTKDVYEYLIYSKLLLIMSNIELGDYDNSDFLIDSFRKMVERQSSQLKDDLRIVLFKKVLVNLKTKEYNFQQIPNRIMDELIKLQKEKRYKWYPTSNEIIPFSFWLLQKNQNLSYNHHEAVINWKSDL
jgi:hypothetical protein